MRWLAVCRLLVRWSSILAPSEQRAEHCREWDAELVAWWQERARRSEPKAVAALRRSLLSAFDAVHLRALHLRARARAERRLSGPPLGPGRRPTSRDLTSSWITDVRFALRSLRSRPQWTAVTVLTLALGIGASTAITSVVRSVVWKPLPYAEPERLVDVWPELWWSPQLISRLRDEAESYEAVAGWADTGLRWTRPDRTELVAAAESTGDFLEVLGAGTPLGRDLDRDDESPEQDHVLVSHGFWQRELGGSPSAVGRTLRIEDRPTEVVGVLPPGLLLMPRDAEIVRPLEMRSSGVHWTGHFLHAVARLRPGVTVEQADAEMKTLAARWREETDRAEDWGREADVVPLRESQIEDVRPTMTLLLAGILCSLLVATANVANLMLARSIERRREVTVRTVLGARPLRLVRQMLTESTVVSLLGGGLGVAAAAFGLPLIVSMLPYDTPRLAEISLDGTMLALSCALTVGIGWLVGLAPAWHAARADLRPAARGAAGGRSGERLRAVLVVAEIALAVLLLVGAGLLGKSFLAAMEVDLGVETQGVLTFTVVPERATLPNEAQVETYYGEVQHQLEALPGVRSVASAHAVPVQNNGWQMGVWPDGDPPPEGSDPSWAFWRPVSPGYFATAGIELVAGRAFQPSDRVDAPRVAILSEKTAATLFPERSPIGARIVYPWDGEEPMTVVGVVRDVRISGPRDELPLVVYRPYPQSQSRLQALGIVWRSITVATSVDPEGLIPAVEGVVVGHDRGAVIHRFETMEQIVAENLSGPRVTATLVGLFALAAFLLGAIGVYGVMERSVTERLRELAIRLALGATDRDVLSSVLGRGLRLTMLGSAIGLAAALGLSRALDSLLFSVSPRDPWVFAGVAGGLALVAVVASWWPARRAGRTDPARTLASE